MSSPRYLTKSRFKIALECPAKLYFTGKDQYANTHDSDEFLKALAEGGYQVGELAKYYHPGGIQIDEIGHQEALDKTKELMNEDNVTLFEGAFAFGGCFIRVDVLKKVGNQIKLIEVKAKSYKSSDEFYKARGGIASSWKPYLWDVAFQTWLMRNVFPEMEVRPYLMLADKNKSSTIDGLNQLFKIHKNSRGRLEVVTPEDLTDEDLGDEILTKVDVSSAVEMILSDDDKPGKNARVDELLEFEERVNQFTSYYSRDERYQVPIGKQCKCCEFCNKHEPEKLSGFDECWSNELNGSYNPLAAHVFSVWNYRKSDELIQGGIYSIDDLYASPDHYKALNDRQKLQVQRTAENDTSEWISDNLSEVINEWKYPLHFIDFETCMVAIPFYSGFRPYEQIAFQFSCHTVHENGQIDHDEWILAEPGVFPNFEFVKELKRILDQDTGTIFRYAAHENTVLRQIQKQMEEQNADKYWEWIEWIDTITQWKDDAGEHHIGERNMVDLWGVLKQHYYHPLMYGSNSIKAVLPAIFQTSETTKSKYSEHLGFGTNLKGMTLWKKDPDSGIVYDPYNLLPDKFQELDLGLEEMVLEDGKISDGAAAAVAFAKMQFTEMPEDERSALKAALLQYCELDTLAMVMIWEHWRSILGEG